MIGDHLFWGYLFPLLVIVVFSIITRTLFVWCDCPRDKYYNQKIPKLFFIICILLGLIPFFNYFVATFIFAFFIITLVSESIRLKDSKEQSKFMKWLMK
jgi:hypothetical protein